jgi:hypothetical protein
MPHGDVETYHSEGRWRNRIEGMQELPGDFGTKHEAVEAGRDHARELKVEHIVRDLDGQIGERSTYGNDPRDIRG